MADNDTRAGRTHLDAQILSYVEELHAPHDNGLATAFAAPQNHAGLPAIQVGRSEGKMIQMLLGLISAKNVVEIGSLAGYSAIRLARGIADNGKVYSLELEPRFAQIAQKNCENAGLGHKVEFLVGPARDNLAKVSSKGPFCAVFIDADKANYHHYGAWAIENLRPGGLLLGDNAFLFGRLLEDSDEGRAMRAFHEQAQKVMDTVCLPTLDGLLIGIKK